jgi:hypothetical protein
VRPAQLNPLPLCTQFTPRGSAPAANRAGPTPAGDLSSGALIARPPSPPRACSTRPGAAAAAPGSPRHYRTCMGGFRSGRVGQHLVARILDLPQPRNETPSPEVSSPPPPSGNANSVGFDGCFAAAVSQIGHAGPVETLDVQLHASRLGWDWSDGLLGYVWNPSK